MLTSHQFERARRLADRLAGIELRERHREALGRRLARQGGDAEAVLSGAERGSPEASARLLRALTIQHTRFFRQAEQLERVASHALFAVERRGAARLWSAATSTGEEAWSLAMIVLARFGGAAPPVSILATDLDPDALALAEAGAYSASALAPVPREYRERWVSAEGRIGPEARALVRFARQNLAEVSWEVKGPLDVVCCRNVLLYLCDDHRYAALERIAGLLAPDGLLLLDPSEHLGAAAPLFGAGSGGVYSARSGESPRARAQRL
jgi:chemotaxis protein methyltransferase CheR